jgi:hypothetical protein
VRTVQVVALTAEEAREELAEFFVDHLIDDRDNLLELIRKGKLGRTVPDLPKLSGGELARVYAEFEFLADGHLSDNPNAAAILIRTDDGQWHCVAERDEETTSTAGDAPSTDGGTTDAAPTTETGKGD